MKLYINDDYVFTKIGRCLYLCLGTKDQVIGATPIQLATMVTQAFAGADYKAIQRSRGHAIN